VASDGPATSRIEIVIFNPEPFSHFVNRGPNPRGGGEAPADVSRRLKRG
jgi:hypothetical protein